jgi:hypothetical protein
MNMNMKLNSNRDLLFSSQLLKRHITSKIIKTNIYKENKNKHENKKEKEKQQEKEKEKEQEKEKEKEDLQKEIDEIKREIYDMEIEEMDINKQTQIENENLNNVKEMMEMHMYVYNKLQDRVINNYNPKINGKKFLVLIACHCNSKIKVNTLKNNLKYFSSDYCHKIVINTENLPYNDIVKKMCNPSKNISYYEIPNTNYCDFGKWVYAIQNLINTDNFDYIVFTNDSFIIHSSINHFFNLAVKQNVDFYGYNDSTQTRYHYQSYLFILKNNAIKTFINHVNSPNLEINNQEDVINNFETKMTDWYYSRDCFLKIGNFEMHKYNNIFFTSDKLYYILKDSYLLPFTKIKRIEQDLELKI